MSSDISVCHVISGDLWAGAEVQVFNLCKALVSSDRVKPSAVVFNHGTLHDRLAEIGIPVSVADETKLGPLAMIRVVVRHCNHHQVNILHTHGFKENILGVFAQWASGVKASVRTVHGNPEFQQHFHASPLKWALHKFDQMIGQYAQAAIVAVSDQLYGKLLPIFGEKVCKIPNFIDVEQIQHEASFCPPRSTNPQIRIGLIGRLVPVKRVDLFIRTIKQLTDEGIDCVGVIFGTGPLETDLKNLTSSLSIEKKIEFRGFVDPLLRCLPELDLLVMPSDHEGLPMTLLEALTVGLPIVAHNTGGIPEALDQGKSGWLVNEHTHHGYAKAVKAILSQPNVTSQKTKNAKTNVAETFGLKGNLMKYNRFYDKVNNHHAG